MRHPRARAVGISALLALASTVDLTAAEHALAACPGAQSPDELAQAISDLADPERGMAAQRLLCRRPDAAVPALLAALTDSRTPIDGRQRALIIHALGKLGRAATSAVKPLLAELASGNEPVMRNACWALGEIGGYTEAGASTVLADLEQAAVPLGGAAQERSIACARLALGLTPTSRELLEQLQSEMHAHNIAASAVLGSASTPPSPEVTRALVVAHRRLQSGWAEYGDGWLRGALGVAEAVAKWLPDSEDGATARACLVRHFDLEVRLRAVMDSGRFSAHAKVAVPALLLAFDDGSVLVRREAVTALGMLGANARGAIADLRCLAENAEEDAQVRRRAQAAMRTIEREIRD